MTQTLAAAPLVAGSSVPMMKNSNLGLSNRTYLDMLVKPNRLSGAGVWNPAGGNGFTEHNAYAASNNVNGVWWEYDIILPTCPAGTRWGCWAYIYKGPTDGIMRITIDGVLQADIDLYAAAPVTGTLHGFWMNRTAGDQNFVCTRPEKVVMRLAANGKNASASGYRFVPLGFQFFSL